VLKSFLLIGSLFSFVAYAQDSEFIALDSTTSTLPKGVIKGDVIYKHFSSDSGFNKQGKKEESPVSVTGNVTAAALSYGFSDKTSIRVGVPVISIRSYLDKNRARTTSGYKSAYENTVTAIATNLAKAGACPSVSSCVDAINSGKVKLPTDVSLPLPSGEVAVIPAGTPLNEGVDSALLNSSKQGDLKGLGDVEAGVLHNVISLSEESKWGLALGAGLRLPTGEYKTVPAGIRPLGRGTLEGIGFVSSDYKVTSGLLLSAQNQSELALEKTYRKQTSQLDATKTTNNAQTIERKGVRNTGFARLNLGLGSVMQEAKLVGIWVKYAWDYDSYFVVDGASQGRSQIEAVRPGVTFNGLAYGVPLKLDIEKDFAVNGKNQAVVAEPLSITLSMMAKF
jgi:hypothetical protein